MFWNNAWVTVHHDGADLPGRVVGMARAEPAGIVYDVHLDDGSYMLDVPVGDLSRPTA